MRKVKEIEVREAWGMITTADGRTMELEGEKFYESPGARWYPIGDLPRRLKGTKVLHIGEELIGEEAHNVINDRVYDTPERVNELFGL